MHNNPERVRDSGTLPAQRHLIHHADDDRPYGAGVEPEDLARVFQAAGLIAIPYRNYVHAQLLPAGTLRAWATRGA